MTTPSEYRNPGPPRRGRTHHPNRTTPTTVPVDGSEPTRAGTPPRIGGQVRGRFRRAWTLRR